MQNAELGGFPESRVNVSYIRANGGARRNRTDDLFNAIDNISLDFNWLSDYVEPPCLNFWRFRV